MGHTYRQPSSDNLVSGIAAMTDDQADTVIAAPGAGSKIVVWAIGVTNADASVATKVSIRSNTTAKITLLAAIGGGFIMGPGGSPIFECAANEAVTAICADDSADVNVFVSGTIETAY